MTIAVISKGKQRATAKIQQQQFNDLFTFPNERKVSIEVEAQQVQEKTVSPELPFRPITFPNSEEDKDIEERFPPPTKPSVSAAAAAPAPAQQNHNANLILQSVDQKFPAHSPSAELARPTRVAAPIAAATAANEILSSRFTDDQLDYIRDFAWNMFQVRWINVYFKCAIQS